ncbi:DNA sulfur modification protein DndD [Cohnella sp. GCM10027633]|uniref:DNA sulfur modification protein DndD n=1 Tax=unclassified Cohnella TaxID=2636738 RepID=UPI003626901F
MKLQSIMLRNIGAYYGSNINKIDFTTSSNQNVILIGGKNGAGKTTLLESIKVVLFGCIAYGFMSESEAYYTRIQSLFNRKAFREKESLYQIILSFESIENFLPVQYVLNRSWNVKGEKTKEEFSVTRDGRLLDSRDTDNFQNRIREEIPPRLFELCLFDGEEISRIISDGQLSDYLSEAAHILFNLDLFINLDKDLAHYINSRDGSSHLQIDTTQRDKLKVEISEMQIELIKQSSNISSLHLEINNKRELLSIKKHDFERHGGIQKDIRDKMIAEINGLENIRKKNSDQIKGFLNDLLPLYLVRNLIQETSNQMNVEESNQTYEQVEKVLNSDSTKQIITSLLNEFNIQIDSNTALQDLLNKKILSMFEPKNNLVIHRASFAQKTEVSSLQHSLDRISSYSFISLFDENNDLLERIQVLKRKLDTNDNSSEFKVLLNEIEELSMTIEQTRHTIEQKQQEEHALSEQINAALSELELENEKLSQLRRAATSFILAEKITQVSQKFQTIQLRKKLDQVQTEAIRMVHRLFRKKDYITRIYISHEDFEIRLFHQQEPMIIQRLSAGEKEMLMLSIIWAMFKTTGWRLPLVFDTLLGRLDQDHKRELIQYFLPNCGEQVIVLSTDSEITSVQFKDLQDCLSRSYTLEFNVASESIDILPDQYFDIYNLEMV